MCGFYDLFDFKWLNPFWCSLVWFFFEWIPWFLFLIWFLKAIQSFRHNDCFYGIVIDFTPDALFLWHLKYSFKSLSIGFYDQAMSIEENTRNSLICSIHTFVFLLRIEFKIEIQIWNFVEIDLGKLKLYFWKITGPNSLRMGKCACELICECIDECSMDYNCKWKS